MTTEQLNEIIHANPEAPADYIREAARALGKRGGLAGKGVKHDISHEKAAANGRAGAKIRWGKRDKAGDVKCMGVDPEKGTDGHDKPQDGVIDAVLLAIVSVLYGYGAAVCLSA